MPKRTLNVASPTRVSPENSSDSNLNDSDSENDNLYEPATKKRYATRSKRRSITQPSLPVEENEHTYSCTPLFSNVINGKDRFDACSSDSDFENEKSGTNRRISERSTSSESVTSTNDKSGHPKLNSSKRQPKCFTKNAVMARINRLRKKEYVEKLEGNVRYFKDCNKDLRCKINDQEKLITTLRSEIQYLRSALSNSKEIGMLIRKVCGGKNDLKITSSLLDTPPSTGSEDNFSSNFTYDGDEKELESWSLPSDYNFDTMAMDDLFSYNSPVRECEPSQPFGVCLHVANKKLSLEFCATCSRSASGVTDENIGIPN